MNKKLVFAWVGVAIAIGITTTMDTNGLAVFSALPLFGLTVVFWIGQRFPLAEMGLRIGKPKHYLLAIAFPLVVMSSIAIIALMTNSINLAEANWNDVAIEVVLISTIGILIGLLTEEGFFRGWLWASLKKSGQSDVSVLYWTTIAFTLWHLSAVTMTREFGLPLPQIPVYLANVFLLGATWGLMRMISGSIIVASVSHSVWNGFAYALFGMGTSPGALGIESTQIFGPEVGWLGLLLNLSFFGFLWMMFRRSNPRQISRQLESVSTD